MALLRVVFAAARSDFLQRLNTIVLPRVRDFEGCDNYARQSLPSGDHLEQKTEHQEVGRPCSTKCVEAGLDPTDFDLKGNYFLQLPSQDRAPSAPLEPCLGWE